MEQSKALICPSHTMQYIAMVVIGFILGAGVTLVIFNPSTGSNTYQAGFDAAKKLVENSSFGGAIHTPDDIRTLSGTVTAVSGNTITVRTQSIDPFEDPALSSRTVTITNDTKMYKLTQKDTKVIQDEMSAYMKAAQSIKPGVTPPTPPTPFTQTSITATDIAVGNTVLINASENIKTAKDFTASEVQVQQSSVTSLPPAPIPGK